MEILRRLKPLREFLIFKGGTCVQSYIDPMLQRASNDLDFNTTIQNPNALMHKIEELNSQLKTLDTAIEILHGIVDSLWVKGQEPEKLCRFATHEIGIPLELKGEFRWIVFLPNKSNGSGALNRYYGVMTNGKLKVRGIEMRRSDTPKLIRNMSTSIKAIVTAATVPK